MGLWLSRQPEPEAPALTDKAWREILHTDEHWSRWAHDELKTKLDSRFGAKENSKKANILLLGPVNSGKSSFVNSVLGASKGRIAHKAYIGEAGHSFTTKYGKYTDDNIFKNFILHDCMGVEQMDGEGFHVNDVIHMVRGNIPKDYKFNPRASISENDPIFDHNPPPEAKIHCVIFVIDATTFRERPPREIITKIGDLQEKLKEMDVPRLLCITKIDQLCAKVKGDLKKTFYSVKVRDVAKRASEVFRIPLGYVHPIKNYAEEVDTNILVDMLLMYPLRQALDFATDYMDKHK